MDLSSGQSAAFSIGTDSSSAYSEDDYKFDGNLVGTQTCHPSHLKTNIGALRRESAQNFEATSTASFARGLTTPGLDENRDYNRDVSSNCMADYRFETQQEAGERCHRSAAEARPVQHSIRPDITLDEPRTFMQRILAEHDAASTRENSDEYRSQDDNNEEPDARLMASASRHIRVTSSNAVPSLHMRGTLLSTTSLASTDSGELMEGSAPETDRYRSMLHEGTHISETSEDIFQPVTPRPRALTLSNISSELRLDHSSSPASGRSVHQPAALSALDGTSGESDMLLPRESSAQWLGRTARNSSLAARRQGRVD